MDWGTVAKFLEGDLRERKLDYCIEYVSKVIEDLPPTPFHLILDCDFSNKHSDLAEHFNSFLNQTQGFVPDALYAEMNGFYINPDHWYFEIFSYRHYGGHDDYDWLAEWDSMYPIKITLSGMEELQQVYATVERASGSLEQAKDFSDLLIVLKFQQLINDSIQFMNCTNCRILATAHDYDFIFENICGMET